MASQAETHINAFRSEAIAAQARADHAQAEADAAFDAFIARGGNPTDVRPVAEKPKAESPAVIPPKGKPNAKSHKVSVKEADDV